MEKLHILKGLFRKEPPPIAWGDWQKAIVENHKIGIPLDLAPQSFQMAKGIMQAFDQMLPVKRGKIDHRIKNDAVTKTLSGLEVSRGLAISLDGTKLVRQKRDAGETGYTENGSYTTRVRLPREIGSIHTHPIDVMPSAKDIQNILQGETVSIVITPKRVITLYRSEKTPHLHLHDAAKDYLEKMGTAKMKSGIIFSCDKKGITSIQKRLWIPNYEDLSDLAIIGYEAPRGKSVFMRQTKN